MGNINKLWIIVAIFIITGFITGTQFKHDQSSSDIITIRSLYEEKKNIENEQSEIDRLNNSINELTDKLESYYSDEYEVEDIIKSLENDLKWNRVLAGQRETQGPGVRIHMEDSLQYEEGQNENNFIIHNSDILQIINDLRGAGAERIAINGAPISWNSKIDCNGATIKVGNEIFAPPFIIEAIGEPEKLESILTAPEGIIQLMRLWDIQIYISKQDNILIKGVPNIQEYKYLKIVEEEGDK
jgi:uncharacterized protein YlxW (UPF0749 family)